jgi:hypothetical protein
MSGSLAPYAGKNFEIFYRCFGRRGVLATLLVIALFVSLIMSFVQQADHFLFFPVQTNPGETFLALKEKISSEKQVGWFGPNHPIAGPFLFFQAQAALAPVVLEKNNVSHNKFIITAGLSEGEVDKIKKETNSETEYFSDTFYIYLLKSR